MKRCANPTCKKVLPGTGGIFYKGKYYCSIPCYSEPERQIAIAKAKEPKMKSNFKLTTDRERIEREAANPSTDGCIGYVLVPAIAMMMTIVVTVAQYLTS